ncbi:hypothetical protein [Dialister sp.]|uniref:hypothetical protein n=1 Tax=Dialister sp. TaxID=1955814 RepID=UPI002E80A1C9|nr:hypothetical protein [Dialister sp.]MEE3453332.1 hypothetical protein [Dialister sp.]
MMKKLLFILSFLVLLAMGQSVFASSSYPDHLGGDPNYILVDGHQGIGYYLDKSSIYLEKDDPQLAILQFNVCTVNNAIKGATEIGHVMTTRMFYDRVQCAMFTYNENTNKWNYINPTAPRAAVRGYMDGAEMAYYITFGKKFYGSRLWAIPGINPPKYLPFHSDEFYARA